MKHTATECPNLRINRSKGNPYRKHLTIAAMAAVLTFAQSSAQITTTYTLNGTTGNFNWNTPASWTGGMVGGVPTSLTDRAQLTGTPTGTITLFLDVNATPGEFLINAGSSETIRFNATGTHFLNTPKFTKGGSSVLTINNHNGGSTSGQLSMTVGAFDVSGGRVEIGRTAFGGMEKFEVTGTTTLSGGEIMMNGGVTNNIIKLGYLNITGGSTFVTVGGRDNNPNNVIEVSALSGTGNVVGFRSSTYGNGGGKLLINSSTSAVYNGRLRDQASIPSSGNPVLVVEKTGSGTQTLTGQNDYSGGTTITAGTLVVAGNQAVGTSASGVKISGTTSGSVLQINAANTIANNITFSSTNASSSVLRLVNSGTAYSIGTTGAFGSNFASAKPDTSATILASQNASSNTTLTMSFSDIASAANDILRQSDIFSIEGTGTDVWVLQLSASGVAADTFVARLVAGTWVNAATDLNGTAGTFAGFYGTSFATFVSGHGGSFNPSTMLGAYGNDGAGNVWAVLDKNSQYSILSVPEPSTVAIVSLGCFALLIRCRARQRHSAR